MTADRMHPVAPPVDHPDQALRFLDLTSTCHRFAAGVGQVLPRLRHQRLSAEQCAVVHADIARARAALDSLVSAVDDCEIDLDGTLIRLLQDT